MRKKKRISSGRKLYRERVEEAGGEKEGKGVILHVFLFEP